MKRLIGGVAVLAMGVGVAAAADWAPVPGRIMTEWAAQVDPKAPLPEYPRPQLARADWVNLNGLWDYAVTATNAEPPAAYDGKILVPFPIESALSGVKRGFQPNEQLWYRRSFKAPKLAGGKRLLLHFGAVDWACEVKVNGKVVGSHRGGFDAFSFDITDAVAPGRNELAVTVRDATGGMQPKGKQNLGALKKSGGIMYTPCSGIWQTVWLEAVPANYIERLVIAPDVDGGVLRVTAVGGGAAEVVVQVSGSGQAVAEAKGRPGEAIAVSIPNPKLWTPDTPYLYTLKVRMGEDEVSSYAGMRKISIGPDAQGITRLLLNNTFVFQSGPLDQGFWPDGIYTAPTDEALSYDVEVTKRLGFNMTRKHVKVEPARWYYWCDKLGLLVWQDMPAGGAGKGANRQKEGARTSDADNAQFEAELKALVDGFRNHPSIVMWIVFNEGWGQYETERLTKWVKELDPSRLVSCASGWNDRPCGDIVDMHNYPGPGSPQPEATRAAVLGEFGGLGLHVDGHTWTAESWGYRGMPSAEALTRKYGDLWARTWQLIGTGLCAAVYTQLTDVENEANGLLTYDRKVIKMDVATAAAAAARGEAPPAPEYAVIIPTAQTVPGPWQYTLEKPADEWTKPGFDASAWTRANNGFGSPGTPGAIVNTLWKTPDIWLRREFDLPALKLKSPALRIHHDEGAEVYINGVLAARLSGFTSDYEEVEITAEAAASLVTKRNVIAIHCRQTMGGQYIDAGIVEQK